MVILQTLTKSAAPSIFASWIHLWTSSTYIRYIPSSFYSVLTTGFSICGFCSYKFQAKIICFMKYEIMELISVPLGISLKMLSFESDDRKVQRCTKEFHLKGTITNRLTAPVRLRYSAFSFWLYFHRHDYIRSINWN